MIEIYIADDRNYQEIEQLKKITKYVFATCYDISWGFLLPCESGVVWEQQTDGVCCHHVYMEGILIPLCRPLKHEPDILGHPFTHLLGELQEANYSGRTFNKRTSDEIWQDIKEASHIDFEFITAPFGMPRNQEGFQWIIYHGHETGYGNSFSIDSWKEKPIVLIYPNCD